MARLRWLRGARIVAAATVTVLLAVAGACSIVITDNLPPYTCLPDADPGRGAVCPGAQVCAPLGEGVFQCMDRCTSFTCHGGVCDPISGWCGPVAEAGAPDGESPNDSTLADGTQVGIDAVAFEAAVDAGPTGSPDGDAGWVEGSTGCHGFGCRCAIDAECVAGFACADRVALTDNLWSIVPDAGGTGAGVCVQPCCTSSDCAAWLGDGGAIEGNVCFATGAGGNYCVPPSWLGDRATLGSNAGGAACGGDAGACRSGLCTSGACADTCCDTKSSNECASSAGFCRFGAFPGSGFDTHQTGNCTWPAVVGTLLGGQQCNGNAACRSNLCVGDPQFARCADGCRNRDLCQAGGMRGAQPQTCSYIQPFTGTSGATDVVAACIPLVGPMGSGDGGADGTVCRSTSDCAHGYCAIPPVGGLGVCLAVCFTDTISGSLNDCPPSERCRPEPLDLGAMTYSVLACGP